MLGTDDLILDLQSLEAVLGEGLGEGVLGDGDADHTQVGGLLLGGLGRQVELTSDQVGALLVEMLVEDDVVHRLGEVSVDLVEEGCGVGRGLSTECLRVLSHGQDAVHLVVVDLRDLMLRHVLNVVAVLDEGVSMDSVLVGAFKALDKVTWVFLIEHDEDPSEADLLLRDLPDTFVSRRLRQVFEESDGAPIAQVVFVLPETVGANTFHWNYTSTASFEPVLGKPGVEATVVEGVEGEPATLDLIRVPELDTGRDQVITDVHVLVLSLMVAFFFDRGGLRGDLKLLKFH